MKFDDGLIWNRLMIYCKEKRSNVIIIILSSNPWKAFSACFLASFLPSSFLSSGKKGKVEGKRRESDKDKQTQTFWMKTAVLDSKKKKNSNNGVRTTQLRFRSSDTETANKKSALLHLHLSEIVEAKNAKRDRFFRLCFWLPWSRSRMRSKLTNLLGQEMGKNENWWTDPKCTEWQLKEKCSKKAVILTWKISCIFPPLPTNYLQDFVFFFPMCFVFGLFSEGRKKKFGFKLLGSIWNANIFESKSKLQAFFSDRMTSEHKSHEICRTFEVQAWARKSLITL